MKTTQYLLLLAILAGIITTGNAQDLIFSRVRIQEEFVGNIGNKISLDHFHRDGNAIVVEISKDELTYLESKQIPFEILIPDVTQYYSEQNHQFSLRSQSELCGFVSDEVPTNFHHGSMGGYLTFDEMKKELDEMRKKYPDLISKALPVSSFETHEGRSVYWTEITGNSGSISSKKNVLYTALHHAREPLSMQQLIYYMWYLLENYEKDPKVTQILDHSVLYFIPCVNPDGYVYNEQVAPEGGGMWRKNRRPLGGDEYGIDLNRNYGYEWGYDNSGSSGDPGSEIYRGDRPFSEPETQAVKWFCEQKDITVALNYHSFGDYLIYPWGFDGETNPEKKTFESLARGLTFEKRILTGTSGETVRYNTNGDADDWMFGETGSKNRIFSMTPEVGPDVYGFWPPKSKITALCQRELRQNINLAIAAQGFIKVIHSYDPIVRKKEFKHPFYLHLLGLEETGVQSSIRPLTNNIDDFQESIYFVGKNQQEEYFINFELGDNVVDGDKIVFEIAFDNGAMKQTDTIVYQYNSSNDPVAVLSDPGDFQNWVRSENDVNAWGLTEGTYYTAPNSITDSPNGDYKPSSVNELTSKESFWIPDEDEEVFLTYKVKWDIKNRKDYARLLISTDNTSFLPLCGNFSSEYFDYGNVSFPAYTGEQTQWLSERISLNEYKGSRVYFKWEMVANSAETSDGIFIDDMKIEYSNTLTSTKESNILDLESFKVFPNPVSTAEVLNAEFNVFEGDSRPAKWEVKDILGRVILWGPLQPGNQTNSVEIPVSGFAPGLYLLNLEFENGRTSRSEKFVVNK